MKRILSMLLVVALVLCSSVTALAGTPSETLKASLTVNGASSVEVEKGDVITVVYKMTSSSDVQVSAAQNEIYYDSNFFDLVSSSNKVDSALSSLYVTSTQTALNGDAYVYFNTINNHNIASSGTVIGELKLKVKATSGSTTVKNENTKAFNASADKFGMSVQNLKVSIKNTAPTPTTYKLTYSVSGSGGTIESSVSSGTMVEADTVVRLTAKPSSGYKVKSWSTGSTANYIDVRMNSTKTITLEFEKTISSVIGGSSSSSTSNNKNNNTTVTPTPQPIPDVYYSDVSKKAWYYNAVQYVSKKGYMSGVGNNKFAPNIAMDRGMFVTTLYRMAGSPNVATTNKFADVKSNAYYAKAVAWAYSNGITTGTSANKFSPKSGITREQMVSMFYRYAKLKGNVEVPGSVPTFKDQNKVSSYAKDAVAWASSNGIISGVKNNNGTVTISPKGVTTRAQMAQVIMNYNEK